LAVELSKNQFNKLIILLAICAVLLATALPMSIAVFPQWNKIKANKLEK